MAHIDSWRFLQQAADEPWGPFSAMRQLSRDLAIALALALVAPVTANAEVMAMPGPGDDVVGELQYTKAYEEDTLLDVARRFSIGQDAIVLANPKVDRWLPHGGTEVLLPKQFVLPDAPRTGIVLNVPEMRLYYFRRGSKNAPGDIVTYPVSIGRMDWRTPRGTTRVVAKEVNPSWRPPETIKREHAADGDFLPDVVPPGPLNPLGKYAMKLGIPGYLIHGTGIDKEFGIGMRVTHGCVRMYPEDVEELFPQVPVGTPVTIVNQPVKVGILNGDWYLEVHPPLEEDNLGYEELLAQAMNAIQKRAGKDNSLPQIDGTAVRAALETPSGYPVIISRQDGAATGEDYGQEEGDPEAMGVVRYRSTAPQQAPTAFPAP